MSFRVTIIHRRCRHRHDHSFPAEPTGAEVTALWKRDCPCCEEEVATASLFETAEVEAEGDDLPNLTGSARQIAFALDVRHAKLRHVAEAIGQAQAAAEKRPELRETVRRQLDALARLEKTTSSHWWIEAREKTVAELLAEVGYAGR